MIRNAINWSVTVPAGQRYIVTITDNGRRLNYTTYVRFLNVGGMWVLGYPRLSY